jgi:hypothetical protein
MALFYFDIVERDGFVSEDDTGTELPSIGAARFEAAHLLVSLFSDLPVDEGKIQALVLDASRRQLFITTLLVQRSETL